MFNFLKNLFKPDAAYEDRFQAALRKFADSDNVYDVKLATLMAQSRTNTLDWVEVDAWIATKGIEKEKMRDSVNRFMTEVQ